jgi:hypothetical protein
MMITEVSSAPADSFAELKVPSSLIRNNTTMTSPLDLTGLVPTLIVVWICAFVIPLGELIIAKYRGRLPARPLLLAALRYVCFGSMFTIFGVAQRANFLGLVSYSLYIFTVVIAALAVGCAGLAGRLQAQAPDRTGSP